MIMMSQYGNMKYAIDSANTETTEENTQSALYENALLSISYDLAEGNFLLYNEYSGRLIRLKCWMNMDREISI